VFERFTEKAQRAVVHAAEEARALQHHYVGTEHLLLGLLRDETSDAFRILGDFGVSLDGCRSSVEQIVGRGQGASSGQLPFTRRAKKVLDLSLRESRRLGHRRIATDHLLLGLLREGAGVAAQMLTRGGVTAGAVEGLVAETEGDPLPGFGDEGDPPVA